MSRRQGGWSTMLFFAAVRCWLQFRRWNATFKNNRRRKAMRPASFALSAVVMMGVGACRAQDYLGISFSPDSLVTCLSDAVKYPCVIKAWIVAWDLASPSGISGWEARVSWSDSIQVDLDALAGRATSNGEYPNLVVALGEPLLSGGLTVLAGLSVVARGSGEIYLSAIENASIPGAEGPVYSEGHGPKVLYEMQYAFGGPKSAVAALGTTECPQPAESRLESFIVTAPKVPVAEHESVIAPEHEMHHSGYDWRESVFADQLTNWCDVVFVGTVEETTRVVTTFLGLPAGAIQALMHVDRDISGAAYENILCYFWGYDVPGRARYRDWWPVPNSNAFAIGQQLFVAARFKKGALFAPPLFFCPIENGNLARGSWFNWQQADSVIERIEERAHLRRQFRVADAIGMAHILSFRPLSLEITHYIRGHGPRQLAVSHVPLPVRGLDEQTPLVVMLEEDQGEWRPIAGRASILVRDSWGRLRTFAGYPLDGSTRIVEK